MSVSKAENIVENTANSGADHSAKTIVENYGLYRPQFEKDNCGFGLIVQMDDKPSHWLVKTAIHALERLTHRGAVAADGKTGDGCGLLLKKPDAFLRSAAKDCGIDLGEFYACGMVFLNREKTQEEQAVKQLENELNNQGLLVGGWRSLSWAGRPPRP